MSNIKKTNFNLANIACRNGYFGIAANLYEKALTQSRGPISSQIQFNINLISRHKVRSSTNHEEILVPTPELDEYFFNLILDKEIFNPHWYLNEYFEKHNVYGNPLAHYIRHGVELSLNPSPKFDTAYYLKTNPDVALSEMHPLLHYVCQGFKEGRRPLPLPGNRDLIEFEVEEPQFISRLPLTAPLISKSVRVIAFYLPQFHPIPENDNWWGTGFTEWSNVRPAKQLFDGHYQPHVPNDTLGYYDLRDESIMHKQIELAKQYGVEGFCFYVYWFSGKRLLEMPVDKYLADSSLDQPFCICWANENWSRRWDGSENEILMNQEYSDEHDIEFIADMAKYLLDSRYIRVNGKPLLIIYRPNLFPNPVKTAARWRKWCLDNHIGEICIAYVQSFDNSPPQTYGFDFAIEFPPSGWYTTPTPIENIELDPGFSGRLLDWRYLVKQSESYENVDSWILRGACPSWDNTARRKRAATVFHRSSPKLFRRWLLNAFTDTITRIEEPDNRLVFINAWNEWAEGAHLEPDNRYGYAWLDAVRYAHETSVKPRIAIVTHDAFPAGAQMLCLHMALNLTEYFGFHVHLISLGKGKLLQKYADKCTLHFLPADDLNSDAGVSFANSLIKKGVHLALVNSSLSGGCVKFFDDAGIKVISLVHELPSVLKHYGLQRETNMIAQYARKIIFPAPQVKAGFEAFLGREVSQGIVRPQGLYQRSWLRAGVDKESIRLNIRKKFGIPLDAKLVMCAGYADYRKGFDLFIEIGVRLMSNRSDVWFLWVGNREEGFDEASMALADRLGLRDHFLFTGIVDEPQPYFLAADVYALTSREDPFPSVILEALDSLTPVVAFQDAGGFEELLKRDCGVLVSHGDVQAFTDALDNLLDQPRKAETLAKIGRNIVEREFNFRQYLFDLLDIGELHIPKVSAIVPNYNYSRYLSDRLDSVIQQTLPLYELIVLDDCSTDDSINVLNEYLKQTDVPWFFDINEANSGSVFNQWRKGAEHARGEYIWIAEADDLVEPTFLARLIAQMQAAGSVLGFTDSQQIDECGNSLSDSYQPYLNQIELGAFDEPFDINGLEFLSRFLAVKNVILNVSGVIVRRDVLLYAFETVGDELQNYRVAGDWRLYAEICAQQGSIISWLPDPLNTHRRHMVSVTNSTNIDAHIAEINVLHSLIGSKVQLSDSIVAMQDEHLIACRTHLTKQSEQF